MSTGEVASFSCPLWTGDIPTADLQIERFKWQATASAAPTRREISATVPAPSTQGETGGVELLHAGIYMSIEK